MTVVAFPLTRHAAIEAYARQLFHVTRHTPDQREPRIIRHCEMHWREMVAHGLPEAAARQQAKELAAALGAWMYDLDQERQQATG